MGTEPMPEDRENARDQRYVRYDQKMSKRVYRSQTIRALFGAGAARVFMRIMNVKASVAQRVLESPETKLRR